MASLLVCRYGSFSWLATGLLFACGPGAAPALVAQPPRDAAAMHKSSSPLSAELRAELVHQAKTHAFRLGHPSAPVFTRVPGGTDSRLLFLRAKGESNPVQGLYELDPKTGQESELVKPEALTQEGELSAEEKARRERQRIAAKGFVAFSVSSDGTHVLLPFAGKLFVFDRATQKASAIEGSEGALDPQFSPNGKVVAFVKEHDVWLADLTTGKTHALTKGGTEEKPHGEAEFAAQEEFSRSRGYFFSPDGATIAVQYTDQSKVERLSLADPARPERAPERPYYPRAGTTNATIAYHLVDVKSGQSKDVRWDHGQFPYVAVARWETGGPFVLYVLDRAQREGRLLAVSPNGDTKPLLTEHDDAWINVDPSVPRFLPDGSFVWSSEKSGHWELTHHAADGSAKRTLLDRNHGYRSVVSIDANGVLCNGGEEPSEGVVWHAPFTGAPRAVATTPGPLLDARAASPGGALFVAEMSLGAWPRYFVQEPSGTQTKVAATFGTPAALPQARAVQLGSDKVRAIVIRPRNAKPGEKLPVLDAAYGGPHVTLAMNNALTLVRAQWMADAVHAVVVILDAAGTPHRGRAWERPLYGKLGSVPLAGHKAALQALGAQVPEADLARVGIYGWSFGGYLSALAVLAEPGFFRAAMAGAPPADWRDYDTAYTERYLGQPQTDAAAYDEASLLTWATREGASSPLLLVHGTADDNVYFLHSLKLADAMARAGKTFEFLPLANITHMLWEEERYVGTWGRAARFFRDTL